MQQYQRLRFHIRMTFEDLKMRINPAWYESRAQELAGIAEQQEFRSIRQGVRRMHSLRAGFTTGKHHAVQRWVQKAEV